MHALQPARPIAQLRHARGAVLIVLSFSTALASANVFNMPPGLTSLSLVQIGNAGNIGEPCGSSVGGTGPGRTCGAVAYDYSIGKFEITAGQYTEFLNAVARTDTYGLYDSRMGDTATWWGANIQRIGIPGSYSYGVASQWANRPVNYLHWGDAARFTNWLTNGQPSGLQSVSTTEDGSYFLNGAISDASLLTISRKPGAAFVLPTEDEWYKAAYHRNDVTGAFWDFPTKSNLTPSNDLLNPDPGNNANFDQSGMTLGAPFYRTTVGDFENSSSAYGTFDQGGNVWEWTEAVVFGAYRGLGGGSFGFDNSYLFAANRYYNVPTSETTYFGFRIALVPDPSTLAIMLLASPWVLSSGRRIR